MRTYQVNEDVMIQLDEQTGVLTIGDTEGNIHGEVDYYPECLFNEIQAADEDEALAILAEYV